MSTNKISVKLLHPSTQQDEENRAKYFEGLLLEDISNSTKSDWAIKFEEIEYTDVAVYKAMIYSNKEDYSKIMSIVVFNLRNSGIVKKCYSLDYSEIGSQ